MIMKKTFIYIAFALLGLTACDILDKEPLSDLSPESYFTTETELKLFSNTFYNSLLDKTPYRSQSDQYIEYDPSDLVKGGNSRTVPASGGGWSFSVLRKINTMLAHMENCEDPAVRAEYEAVGRFFRAYFYVEKVKRFGDVPWIETELQSDSEQLYAPRDSREYVMTKLLADLDFAIENLPVSSTPYRVNKWTALAVKSNICLFEGTFRKYHDLKIEGNDWKHYLTLSYKAAEDIMLNGPYSLHSTGDPSKDYMELFISEATDNKEYILAVNYDEGLGVLHNATWYGIGASSGRVGVTKKIVDSYLMKDGSRFTDKAGWETMQFVQQVADRDPRLAQSIRTPGYKRTGSADIALPDFDCTVTGYQTIKYVQPFGLSSDGYNKAFCDMPVLRLAEQYLNYAEAKAELGILEQSDLDISINLLRDRVGMVHLEKAVANADPDEYLESENFGYPNVDKGENKGVILEIRRERTIELAQEGSRRWYDLMRWKEGKCVEQPMHGMYFPGAGEYDLDGNGTLDLCLYTGSKPSTKATVIKQIGVDIKLSEGTSGYVDPIKGNSIECVFDEGRDYLYPIPSDDQSLNKNLKQNPGWPDLNAAAE